MFNYGTEQQKYTIDAELYDAAGNVVVARQLKGNVFPGTKHLALEKIDGLDIQPWSAEAPNLYKLHLALKSEAGKELAHYAFPVGFVRKEIKDGNLLVNGKPVLIKGVDRHDHDDITGPLYSGSHDARRARSDEAAQH